MCEKWLVVIPSPGVLPRMYIGEDACTLLGVLIPIQSKVIIKHVFLNASETLHTIMALDCNKVYT